MPQRNPNRTEPPILLAQKLASRPEGKLLHDTACMNDEERELYGIIKAIELAIPEGEGQDFKDFCEKIFLPMIQAIGQGRWVFQELTHLALKYGKGGIPINMGGVAEKRKAAALARAK